MRAVLEKLLIKFVWPKGFSTRLLRGLSQIIFPTVSVIMTLRGGGSEGVTLIFYLKHTLTFVIILQPSDVNFNHFQLHAQKLTLKFLARFHKNCTHVSEG